MSHGFPMINDSIIIGNHSTTTVSLVNLNLTTLQKQKQVRMIRNLFWKKQMYPIQESFILFNTYTALVMVTDSEILIVNLPEMYSDSPQKQTPITDFYVDSSHETVQRLYHAYQADFRYLSTLLFILIIVSLQNFRIFNTKLRQSCFRNNSRNLQRTKKSRNQIKATA